MGVIVTGGAGGIGSAVSRAFAAEGAKVVVHYRTSERAAMELAAEIDGLAIGWWPRDDTPIWEMDPDRWRATLDSNLTATFLTARGFLGHAAGSGEGALVMIGSTAGSFGEAGHADYAAAKGAIMSGLLMSLKNEAARIGPGVRVNAVAPGWTVTPMIGDKGLDPDHVAMVTSTMSIKKLGKPQDVAAQVVVLASSALSGHLSGQVVTVAGGMEGRQIP